MAKEWGVDKPLPRSSKIIEQDPRDNEISKLRAEIQRLNTQANVKHETPMLDSELPHARKPQTALVFDVCRAWRLPYTFPVPLSTQNLTVVYVRNNQLASAEPLYNVRARIDYLRDNRPAFSIDAAVWWDENLKHALRTVTRVDLEPNESQCFAVFMEPSDTNQPQGSPQTGLFAESDGFGARDLTAGRWTARITVTADHKEPLCGEIEFTVYSREGVDQLVISKDGDLGAMRLPVKCGSMS
jgi:hypothetical protein